MKITKMAHLQAAQFLEDGSVAVDATAGNGLDTLFLAGHVGPEGRVYAFDIQEEALRRTAAALAEARLRERVTLLHAGHERMADYVSGPVQVVMFNLGYLPAGDRAIVTRAETTLAGVARALELLAPGGLLSIVIYPGHNEGALEREALLTFCESLSPRDFTAASLTLLNRAKQPPGLITIVKSGSGQPIS